jgi:ribosome-binding factor A
MAREFKRTDRVAEQLQREVAQIIQFELKDPRLGMVTVCAADISRDLYHATLFVTFLGIDDDQIDDAVLILNEAAGYIRKLVGQRMRLRTVPQLKFKYDQSVQRGRQLTDLIKKARAKDQGSDSN